MYITDKTLKDLEFPQVLETVKSFALSEFGAQEIEQIKPIEDRELLLIHLKETDEYLTSFHNNNRIPNHGFQDISKAILYLGIENTFIEPKVLLDIVSNVSIIQELTQFFENFKLLYPLLHDKISDLPRNFEIITLITARIDKFAEVADNASPDLKNIRLEKM